jgi:hypothetical protein
MRTQKTKIRPIFPESGISGAESDIPLRQRHGVAIFVNLTEAKL